MSHVRKSPRPFLLSSSDARRALSNVARPYGASFSLSFFLSFYLSASHLSKNLWRCSASCMVCSSNNFPHPDPPRPQQPQYTWKTPHHSFTHWNRLYKHFDLPLSPVLLRCWPTIQPLENRLIRLLLLPIFCAFSACRSSELFIVGIGGMGGTFSFSAIAVPPMPAAARLLFRLRLFSLVCDRLLALSSRPTRSPSSDLKSLGLAATGVLGLGPPMVLRLLFSLSLSFSDSPFSVGFGLKSTFLHALSPRSATVMPPFARFSSGIGTNFTMPRCAGTPRFSAKKTWSRLALRLLTVG